MCSARKLKRRRGEVKPQFLCPAAAKSDCISPGIPPRCTSRQHNSAAMKAIAVIPARLASTRLPRKMLREIAGKPLIGVVYESVLASPLLADVIVATDSEEIMAACRQRG